MLIELNKCKKAELSCRKWQASSTFNFLKVHSKSILALWIHFLPLQYINCFYLLIRKKSSTAELQSSILCLKAMTGEENFAQSVLLNSYCCLKHFWKSQPESFSTNNIWEKNVCAFCFFLWENVQYTLLAKVRSLSLPFRYLLPVRITNFQRSSA